MLNIRPATDEDRDAIWGIFKHVLAAAETYPLDPETQREDALAYWFGDDIHTHVAIDHGVVVGAYLIKANQKGGGSHVANAGFIVGPEARGKGVGRALGEHCFAMARRLGFRAMQFNFVVSTNEAAVRLWQDFGMKIVGTLPGAFRHPTKGYVDVYVMFRSLVD